MCCCIEDLVERFCCCIPRRVLENIWNCIIVLGAVIVVVAPIYGRPLRRAKIRVEDASLTRFDLVTTATPTTTAALAYNLTLALTVRNTNWPIGITYAEPLEAAYSFGGQQLDRVQVADKGGKVGGVALGNATAGEAEFRKQNATGTFEVEVAVTGRFKYTLREIKCKVQATCALKLQVAPPPGATGAVVFQEVGCEVAHGENENC